MVFVRMTITANIATTYALVDSYYYSTALPSTDPQKCITKHNFQLLNQLFEATHHKSLDTKRIRLQRNNDYLQDEPSSAWLLGQS